MDRETAAATRPGRRRALLVTVATAAEQLRAELVQAGWDVGVVDATVEDPFADADDLAARMDLTGVEVVLTAGGGSSTAKTLAVLADVPIAPLGVPEARRLAAIAATLDAGTAVHRSVVDARVDGARRFVTGPLEVHSPRPVDARMDDVRSLRIPAGAEVRIAAERPMSGQLIVNIPHLPAERVTRVVLRCRDGEARLDATPRSQQFRELDVALHDRQLRELLLS